MFKLRWGLTLVLFSTFWLLGSNASAQTKCGNTNTVKIDPDMGPNPLGKAGYFLLFNDEFDFGTNTGNWSLGNIGNNAICNPETNMVPNPVNVSSVPGEAILNVNTNSNGGCAFSGS